MFASWRSSAVAINNINMKKILILLAGLILTGAGCNYQIVSKTYVSTSTPQRASLDDQSKCAKQAEYVFKDLGYKDTSDGSKNNYLNHYNNSLGICFIQINSWSNINGNFMEQNFLSDAFEGKSYADFSSSGSDVFSMNVLSCNMLDNQCETRLEYDNFVKQYMEN